MRLVIACAAGVSLSGRAGGGADGKTLAAAKAPGAAVAGAVAPPQAELRLMRQ